MCAGLFGHFNLQFVLRVAWHFECTVLIDGGGPSCLSWAASEQAYEYHGGVRGGCVAWREVLKNKKVKVKLVIDKSILYAVANHH